MYLNLYNTHVSERANYSKKSPELFKHQPRTIMSIPAQISKQRKKQVI